MDVSTYYPNRCFLSCHLTDVINSKHSVSVCTLQRTKEERGLHPGTQGPVTRLRWQRELVPPLTAWLLSAVCSSLSSANPEISDCCVCRLGAAGGPPGCHPQRFWDGRGHMDHNQPSPGSQELQYLHRLRWREPALDSQRHSCWGRGVMGPSP